MVVIVILFISSMMDCQMSFAAVCQGFIASIKPTITVLNLIEDLTSTVMLFSVIAELAKEKALSVIGLTLTHLDISLSVHGTSHIEPLADRSFNDTPRVFIAVSVVRTESVHILATLFEFISFIVEAVFSSKVDIMWMVRHLILFAIACGYAIWSNKLTEVVVTVEVVVEAAIGGAVEAGVLV